jgi:ankyrin repeat protein
MDPALHKAAVQGSVASLRKLVADRPDILGSRTPQENTALHIAAELGHAGFAEEVLSVNEKLLVSKNADGDTPLHLAARAGKGDVAELLIGRASVWPEKQRQYSLTVAQKGKTGEPSPSFHESAQGPLLMANKVGDTPLHEAVKHGWSAVALKLLAAEPSRGHALNVKNQSPLHIAAREGLADVVEKILRQPWVHQRFVPSDSVSGTALHQAVLGGHTRKLNTPFPTITSGSGLHTIRVKLIN